MTGTPSFGNDIHSPPLSYPHVVSGYPGHGLHATKGNRRSFLDSRLKLSGMTGTPTFGNDIMLSGMTEKSGYPELRSFLPPCVPSQHLNKEGSPGIRDCLLIEIQHEHQLNVTSARSFSSTPRTSRPGFDTGRCPSASSHLNYPCRPMWSCTDRHPSSHQPSTSEPSRPAYYRSQM